ncbi:MAG: hypothetical protein H7A51_04930 [Akkermansiaceae bacterium]|nr:hypothetical protein [Akkermansiaceae bacterium]
MSVYKLYFLAICGMLSLANVYAGESIQLIQKQSFGDGSSKVNPSGGLLGEVLGKQLNLQMLENTQASIHYNGNKLFNLPKGVVLEGLVIKKELVVFHLMKNVRGGRNHHSLVILSLGKHPGMTYAYVAGKSFYKGEKVRIFELLDIKPDGEIVCILGIGKNEIKHYKAQLDVRDYVINNGFNCKFSENEL